MTLDRPGYFGPFGGRFVPETLIPAIDELTGAFYESIEDPEFRARLYEDFVRFSGRPTPLYYAERLTEKVGGARIYLKREDLNHTGAHKINNTLGQVHLALRMGKKRIIAETGAGQHGVATATVCARYGLQCIVYMGEEDTKRQALNLFRMRLLGAEVRSVTSGTRTLKDATNEAIRDWVTNVEDTYYLIGSVVGMHPYPTMVRHFQSIIGEECREQMLETESRLPDAVVACVGGGSNAIGIFHAFRDDPDVKLIGVEAGGEGLDGRHSAPLSVGSHGVLHGSMSYLLQDEDGQILPAHSISAGLDYPGVGPEHSYLRETGRATYVHATDDEALNAFMTLTKYEGIMPALESSHAVAHALKLAGDLGKDGVIVVNLSGRGDKDVHQVQQLLEQRPDLETGGDLS